MGNLTRTWRWGLAALSGGASMALGAWAVWRFAPGAFGALTTWELAALVGLLVLPALTLLAAAAERRARRQSPGATVEVRPESRRVVHEPGVMDRPPPVRGRSVDLDSLRP